MRNKYLLRIMVAAANGEGCTLNAAECKKLANDVFTKTIDSMTIPEFERLVRWGESRSLRDTARLSDFRQFSLTAHPQSIAAESTSSPNAPSS